MWLKLYSSPKQISLHRPWWGWCATGRFTCFKRPLIYPHTEPQFSLSRPCLVQSYMLLTEHIYQYFCCRLKASQQSSFSIDRMRQMVVASKILFHHVIVCLWSKFAHKCSIETAIFTRPRKRIAVSALPPSAINCGKWWWRQASFVIVVLFADQCICRAVMPK